MKKLLNKINQLFAPKQKNIKEIIEEVKQEPLQEAPVQPKPKRKYKKRTTK